MPHTSENVENNSEVSHQTTFEKHKAERWERYLQAVKQLRSKEASARVSGVHALVVLVDEWLHEENLSEDKKIKEGQLIINKLCAYICSPFALASEYDELIQDSPAAEGLYKNREQEFYIHKAELQAEADVRLSIMKEIHARLQGPNKNTPGAWSDFEYDFSGSAFFYPIDLTNSYYTKPVNFSGSTYQDEVRFDGSVYKDEADFGSSIYKSWATFDGSTYQALADFSGSTYQWADFSGSTYKGWADFTDSTYKGGANFTGSTYQALADFTDSTYKSWADFSGSTYQALAYFSRSIYQGGAYFTGSTYRGRAYFSRSTYQEEAYFSDSTYKSWAYFTGSTYQGRAYFSRSTYNDVADFSGSIFYQKVYFGADGDNSSFSRFTGCAPQFYDETNRKNTLFGSPDNDFSVENGRGYPIYRNFEGLPLGCKFLTSEQKEYLADKFYEIDETKNKLREVVKDPKEKAELSKNLQALTEELHEWREEATTVNVEGTALGEDDN